MKKRIASKTPTRVLNPGELSTVQGGSIFTPYVKATQKVFYEYQLEDLLVTSSF